jgi:TolB-like protein
MTRRIVVVMLLSLAVAWAAYAKPDLVVSSLEITPTVPLSGSTVTIVARIANVGDSDAEGPFFVRFEVDDAEIDTASMSFGIAAGDTRDVSATWIAKEGPHILSVDVDQPFNRVSESRETNNSDSIPIIVPFGALLGSQLANLRIAVAPFDDQSHKGFVNMGEGLADKLADRFVQNGLRVVAQGELESFLQENDLDPHSPADLARAARALGVDLVVTGTIERVDLQETSVNLGILKLSSAAVDVKATARLIVAASSEIAAAVSADGHQEGTTGFSVDLGSLLSLSEPDVVCDGGFRSDRTSYSIGQLATIGYRNPDHSGWFSVEIYSSTGTFLRWLGWRFIGAGDCDTWSWDQRDPFGIQMSPGFYTAKLWNGTSYIAALNLQITPGIGFSIPPAEEITVGTPSFDETIVGAAVNQAADQLAASLLTSMAGLAATGSEDRMLMSAGAPALEAEQPEIERVGQVAALLPDGRVVINIGASAGVAVGDRFEILEIENLVLDPQTLEILTYDVVAKKGEIQITEVRDRAAYGLRIGDFEPVIGDLARALPE